MRDEIIITDGIDIDEMRALHEVTNIMAKAINREEFEQIMLIYDKATRRLLKDVEDK